MSVPQDELDMLRVMASQGQTAPPQQPSGMIQTDPGSMDAFMQNQRIMQQLGASSADPEKRAALDKQMALAKYLGQGTDMPKGTHIPGYMGGVYVAPNALQNAAAVGHHVLGAMYGKQAADAETEMASQEARNRTAIMEMYRQQFNRPPMSEPDISSLLSQGNPLENYNFGPQGGPPRNTNLVPGQAAPRQLTPDELMGGG